MQDLHILSDEMSSTSIHLVYMSLLFLMVVVLIDFIGFNDNYERVVSYVHNRRLSLFVQTHNPQYTSEIMRDKSFARSDEKGEVDNLDIDMQLREVDNNDIKSIKEKKTSKYDPSIGHLPETQANLVTSTYDRKLFQWTNTTRSQSSAQGMKNDLESTHFLRRNLFNYVKSDNNESVDIDPDLYPELDLVMIFYAFLPTNKPWHMLLNNYMDDIIQTGILPRLRSFYICLSTHSNNDLVTSFSTNEPDLEHTLGMERLRNATNFIDGKLQGYLDKVQYDLTLGKINIL